MIVIRSWSRERAPTEGKTDKILSAHSSMREREGREASRNVMMLELLKVSQDLGERLYYIDFARNIKREESRLLQNDRGREANPRAFPISGGP